MEEKSARIISYLLHPLLMPTLAMLLLLQQSAYFVMMLPESFRWSLLALIFGNTFLLPAILIWIMLKKGLISSMQIPERSERTYPFIITALSYIVTYFMLSNIGLPPVYLLFVLGGAVLIVFAAIVNLFWKISVHMLGIGGLLGGFIGLMLIRQIYSPMLIVILIILGGLTGFARLKLNTHTEAQVYAGFLSGAGIMLGIVAFL